MACATKRGGVWIETSVEDFRAKIRQFALGLHDLGVRKGDRVALHAENSTEWLIVDQAVLRLGAVTVPIYTTQPSDQINYILEDAEARRSRRCMGEGKCLGSGSRPALKRRAHWLKPRRG